VAGGVYYEEPVLGAANGHNGQGIFVQEEG
jgi:hypothetical protein